MPLAIHLPIHLCIHIDAPHHSLTIHSPLTHYSLTAQVNQPAEVLHHWSCGSARVPPFQPEMVPQFCFPKGVPIASLRRTKSLSALDEVIFERAHVHRSTHTFVFRMTDEHGRASYGFCVMCEESIEQPPTFVDDANQQNLDPAVVLS